MSNKFYYCLRIERFPLVVILQQTKPSCLSIFKLYFKLMTFFLGLGITITYPTTLLRMLNLG